MQEERTYFIFPFKVLFFSNFKMKGGKKMLIELHQNVPQWTKNPSSLTWTVVQCPARRAIPPSISASPPLYPKCLTFEPCSD